MAWVIRLVRTPRPHSKDEQFPRVINVIAAGWSDLPHGLQFIDRMVNDYRGGRLGFPVAVRTELLAQHARQRLPERGQSVERD